ncbi:hypothetical protein TI04_06815 [Achromatium sp. WMS2]|nr:hypothetical protein TI04_06815 [Achromatium sp. WMS2]
MVGPHPPAPLSIDGEGGKGRLGAQPGRVRIAYLFYTTTLYSVIPAWIAGIQKPGMVTHPLMKRGEGVSPAYTPNLDAHAPKPPYSSLAILKKNLYTKARRFF